MSFYLTLREGPSAATSVPLLVVCDDRLIGAFMRELRRITQTRARRTESLPVPPVSPVPAGAPPMMPTTPRPRGAARPSSRTPSTGIREERASDEHTQRPLSRMTGG
jgi:hypothetical protein